MTEREDRIAELKEQIKLLEPMADPATQELVQTKKLELESLLAEAPAGKGAEMVMGAEGEILLPTTDEEWIKGGSKFVSIPPGRDFVDLDIEMGLPILEASGISIAFPVTVVEDGPDYGKESKISGGIRAGMTWKTREIVLAVTGSDLEFRKGKDNKLHPVLKPSEIAGMTAVGHWERAKGVKGGVSGAEVVEYPKLVSILPAGVKTEEGLF